MPDLNKVFLAGRLTRDPEMKYTSTGKPLCKFGIANSYYYKDGNGERQEKTTFADVTVWGPHAEFVGEHLSKGRPVLIEGSLETSEWEDSNTGQRRSKMGINAQRVTPLDWHEKKQECSAQTPRDKHNEAKANDGQPEPQGGFGTNHRISREAFRVWR